MKKKLPKFNTVEKEAEFWKQHDSTDYIDWNKAKKARFPALKPSATTISLRLPMSLLHEIKIIAHKEDVPYQSLIKIILSHEISLMRKYKEKEKVKN